MAIAGAGPAFEGPAITITVVITRAAFRVSHSAGSRRISRSRNFAFANAKSRRHFRTEFWRFRKRTLQKARMKKGGV